MHLYIHVCVFSKNESSHESSNKYADKITERSTTRIQYWYICESFVKFRLFNAKDWNVGACYVFAFS